MSFNPLRNNLNTHNIAPTSFKNNFTHSKNKGPSPYQLSSKENQYAVQQEIYQPNSRTHEQSGCSKYELHKSKIEQIRQKYQNRSRQKQKLKYNNKASTQQQLVPKPVILQNYNNNYQNSHKTLVTESYVQTPKKMLKSFSQANKTLEDLVRIRENCANKISSNPLSNIQKIVKDRRIRTQYNNIQEIEYVRDRKSIEKLELKRNNSLINHQSRLLELNREGEFNSNVVRRPQSIHLHRSNSKNREEERIGSITKINTKIKELLNIMNQNERNQDEIKALTNHESFKLFNLQSELPEIEVKRQPKFFNLHQIRSQNHVNELQRQVSKLTMNQSKISKSRAIEVKQSKFLIPQSAKDSRIILTKNQKNDRSFKQWNEDIQEQGLKTPVREKPNKLGEYPPIVCKQPTKTKLQKQELEKQIKRIKQKIQKSGSKDNNNIRFDQIKNKTIIFKKENESYQNKTVKNKLEFENNNYYYYPDEIDRNESPFRFLQKDNYEFQYINNIKTQVQRTLSKNNNYPSNKNLNNTNQGYNSISVRIDDQGQAQTKKLIKIIQEQIKLDEIFRNSKVWFESLKGTNQKWQQLRTVLNNKYINLTFNQMKSEFQNTPEEHNPFYNNQQDKESIQLLVCKYIESNQFWKNNLLHKFKKDNLSRQNFTADTLDLEGKGFLLVEDFVRFLNIETGMFYRNRDLILLFRRWTKQKTLSFVGFMKKITQDSGC